MRSGGERRVGLQSVVLTGQVAAARWSRCRAVSGSIPNTAAALATGSSSHVTRRRTSASVRASRASAGEDATGLDAVDHGVVGGSGWVELDRSQALVQPAASGEAAPLVPTTRWATPCSHTSAASPAGTSSRQRHAVRNVSATASSTGWRGTRLAKKSRMAGSTVRRAARTAGHRRNVRRPQSPSRRSYPVNAQHSIARDAEFTSSPNAPCRACPP